MGVASEVELEDADAVLAWLQSPVLVNVPGNNSMSTADAVKDFCKEFFDQQASTTRAASERLKSYVMNDGGDAGDVKEIVKMCTERMQALRRKLDDFENTSIAAILTAQKSRDR